MNQIIENKKAKMIRTLVDFKLTIDPPNYVGKWCRTTEEKIKEMEQWAMDLMEFIRDHRSQDQINVEEEKQYQYQCSNCNNDYEEMEENGIICCAHCGAEIEK